jgi:hypothetical protein
VPQLQPGLYKLRIVGDGLDPALAQSRGQTQCIQDQQPLPYTSAGFFIVGSSQLVSYPDTFGPSNDGVSTKLGSVGGNSGWFVLMSLGTALVVSFGLSRLSVF